jgi:hypothetical protein
MKEASSDSSASYVDPDSPEKIDDNSKKETLHDEGEAVIKSQVRGEEEQFQVENATETNKDSKSQVQNTPEISGREALEETTDNTNEAEALENQTDPET